MIQIAQPGDTLESIAEENALAPEQILQANPDLVDPPAPGEWVNVPTGENVPPDSDDIPGGVDDDLEYGQDFPDLPAVPAAPIPPFAFPRFWSTFIQPPVEPTDLQVLPGNCLAVLTWSDRSNNEAGFYVYRLNPGVGLVNHRRIGC